MIPDGSYRWVVGVLVVTLAAALCPGTARGSCAGCHEHLQQDPTWAHSYEDWWGSMHAAQDITCRDCHGGDGETENPAEAHASMWLRAGADSDGGSAVVVGCGGCHADEYAAGREGPHAWASETGRRGARCTDCHGPAGDRVPTADDLVLTCRPCHASHRERTMVSSVEQLLSELARLRLALAFPEASRVSADREQSLAGQRRGRAAEAVRAAMAAWHRLDLPAIARAVAEAVEAMEPGLDPE